MQITREKLTATLAAITKRKHQLTADLNAVLGAEQLIRELIAECEKPEPLLDEAKPAQ